MKSLERSINLENVNAQSFWFYELGDGFGAIAPIQKMLGIQQEERLNDELRKTGTFFRPPVVKAHCIIGAEKKPRNWYKF